MAHTSQADPSGAVRRGGTFLPPKAGCSLNGRDIPLKLHIHVLRVTAGPQDFERIKLVGQGDVGKVYLVRLCSSRDIFAMKVLSKAEMIKRNKVYLSATT
jgi:hypothetical protein